MSKGLIVLIVVLVLVAAAIIGLVIYFNKQQKKVKESEAQIDAMKQTMPMLIIDKKIMKMKDAGFPQSVMDQTPWYLKGMKFPILKVRVAGRVMPLICENKIFDMVPVKKEVKATVSGMYVTKVEGLHGKLPMPEAKKKGFFKNLVAKAQEKAGAKMVK